MNEFFKWLYGLKISFTNIISAATLGYCLWFLWWLASQSIKGRLPQEVADIKIAIISLMGTIAGFIWGYSQGKKTEAEGASKGLNVNVENVEDAKISGIGEKKANN